MNAKNFVKNIFIFALLIFQFLGLTSLIARGMLIIILVIAVCSLSLSYKYLSRPVVNGFFLLLALNIAYYLISPKIVVGTYVWETTGFFANSAMNLGVFFIAYFFSVNKILKDSDIQFFFIIAFILTAIRFLVTRDNILIERDGQMRTMNMAYSFVIFMPYLLLFRHKLVPILFLIPSLYFVLYGGKRGAILIYVISIAFIIYNYYFTNYKKHFAQNLIIVSILCYVFFVMATELFQQSSLLQHRLEQTLDGNSSGRDDIFGAIWDAWVNGNVFHFIFGFGFCSSVRFAGNYAHNDWLELLSTAGLIGLIVYIVYFMQLYIFSKKVYNKKDKQVLYLILLIWFLKSLFSMSYCSVGNMPMTFLCGYIVGRNQSIIKSSM